MDRATPGYLAAHYRAAMIVVTLAAMAAGCSSTPSSSGPPIIAQAPPGALSVADVIERVGPTTEPPKELPKDISFVAIAVVVTGGCPACEGPDPCAPCEPRLHEFADDLNGPRITAHIDSYDFEKGHRYLIKGEVVDAKDRGLSASWLVFSYQVHEIRPKPPAR